MLQAQVSLMTANTLYPSGNSSSASNTDFIIDRNAPVISVSGVKNENAYTNEIIAFHIDVTDANIASTSIKLTATCRKDGKYVTETVPYDATEVIAGGTRYIWSNINEDGDGIYSLSCSATDKAGNTTTALREKSGENDNNSVIKFSVNRRGSTYAVSEVSSSIIGTWQTSSKNLELTEINADPIDIDNVVVKLTNKSTEAEKILKAGQDFTVELVSSDGTWYEYKYTILSSSFTSDGYYDIEITSKDTSTQKVTSTKNNAYGETLVSYGLDTHGPNIDISGINNGPYDSITRDAVVTVTDISLDKVTIYLNDEVVQQWTASSAGETFTGTISINESDFTQTLRVEALDAAGNSSESQQDVFVSSSGFSIFMYRARDFLSHNAVLLICLGVALVGLIVGLIVYNKNKKKAHTKKSVK